MSLLILHLITRGATLLGCATPGNDHSVPETSGRMDVMGAESDDQAVLMPGMTGRVAAALAANRHEKGTNVEEFPE